MNIELHITDITPAELQKLAMVLNESRRFKLEPVIDTETPVLPKVLSNTPLKHGCGSRPIVGSRDGEKMEWPSVAACAHNLGVAMSSVARSIKEDRYMKGWKLYYKTDEDIKAEKEGTKDPDEIRIPEDTKAPDWSRDPQPIIGIKGKEQRRWESIYQCTRDLHSGYETVKKAARQYLHVNGYLLMFEDIKQKI